MDEQNQFRFPSVIQLDRQLAACGPAATQPQMANISEHSVTLPDGGVAVMRKFDTGDFTPPAPSIVLFEPSPNGDFPRSLDILSRHLAEATGVPVLGVTSSRRLTRIDPSWLFSWWSHVQSDGVGVDIDAHRIVLGARGATAASLLQIVPNLGAAGPTLPRGLFLMYGDYGAFDPGLARLRFDHGAQTPPIYIAGTGTEHERIRTRRLCAHLLASGVPHWLVEWPGVVAECLDHIARVPEMERYIDAMAVCLRGLLHCAPVNAQVESQFSKESYK